MTDRAGRKTALVTGASGGLGRAIALKLADKGFALALTARNFDELEKTRRLSRLAARDALILLADLSLDDAPDQIFDATLNQNGRIDVLINAAHAAPSGASFLQLEAADQARLLAVNLHGPIALARLAARWMNKQSTGGTIINFVCGASAPCDPITAAAEAGILAFSQAAATVLRAGRIRIVAMLVASMAYRSLAENGMAFIGASYDSHPIAVGLKD
jgi:short-subunit dehydrogenase